MRKGGGKKGGKKRKKKREKAGGGKGERRGGRGGGRRRVGGALGQGLGGLFGLGEFGSLCQAPRIDNLSVADVVQSLSARSSITAAGGYEIVHFTDNTANFVDSNQITAQVGYDYQLSRRSQVAVIYGFQDFQYPNLPGS